MTANPQLQTQYSKLNQHINRYVRPNNTKAWISIAFSFIIEAIAIVLINLNVYYLGWTIHTLNMVRFFIQFHDMAHFSFFETIAMNKFVGHIIGLYVLFPFQMWRDGHNYHHRFFGNLDRVDLSQTILFTKKEYESWSTHKKIAIRIFRQPFIFFFLSVQIIWYFGILGNVIKKYGIFSIPFLQKMLSFGVYYLLYLLELPVLQYFIGLYLAMTIGTTLFHLQHSVNLPYRQHKEKWSYQKAALEGSTFLQIPSILRPFTNGIEYHHIHHLNTNVASYVIDQCHQKFDGKKDLNWNTFNINKVDLMLSIKSMLNVMLDEQTGKLIPFSYTSL